MYALGIDLGGTKTAAGIVSAAGEVLFSETIPTESRGGGEKILDSTGQLAQRLILRASSEGMRVDGVGVGSAGVIDAQQGKVISATDALYGWSGTDILTGLSERLGISKAKIRVVNDVHAHALGESWVGASSGSKTSLLVAFGTGVGGSFINGKEPLLGHRFVAGHVGHFASSFAVGREGKLPCVCGGYGHVEAIAAGPAIARAYLREGGTSTVADAREVFALAHEGEELASSVVEKSACAAGEAVGGLANMMDPEVIVISGGLAEAGPSWWLPMERAARAELLPALDDLAILPAKLGNWAAVVGAAGLLLRSKNNDQKELIR